MHGLQNSLQNGLNNRIHFGDTILSRLQAASIAGAKPEREAFADKHEALLAVRRDLDAAVDTPPPDPPPSLLHAWDAALLRLTDRVRGESPELAKEVFAATGGTVRGKVEPKGKARKTNANANANAKTKAKTKTKSASAAPPAIAKTPEKIGKRKKATKKER